MEKKKSTLDIWHNCWMPLTYFPNWGSNIKIFFRNIKYSYQRIRYGFCERDTWNLDCYLTNLMADSIDHLADNTCGYPGDDTPEGKTFEAWQAYLHEMATLFRHSLEDEYYHNKYDDEVIKTFDKITWDDNGSGTGMIMNEHLTPEEKDIKKLWLDESVNIYNLQKADRDKALDMLKARFDALWD